MVFEPWREETWDRNDTAVQDDPTLDPDVGDFFTRLPAADYSPTWRVQRANGGLGAQEQAAAIKAAAHANTPAVSYLDVLGRTFLSIVDNGPAGKYPTHTELDIQNNQRSVTDALGRKIVTYDYSLLGDRIHQSSMEAGERWTLDDVVRQPIRAWDTRGHNFRTEYDSLRRAVHHFVLGTDAANSDQRTLGGEVMIEKTEYGEGQPNDQIFNLRTRVFRHSDAAGIAVNFVTDPSTQQQIAFDFKGNLLGTSRQFLLDYKALPDWSKPPPALLADVFVSTTRYDALNRVTASRTPDGSIVQPSYNEASLLESVSVDLRASGTLSSFISNIDYDAKGDRLLVEYGNPGAPFAVTAYSYDQLTFRLTGLITTRPALPAAQQPAQSLSYTYDPVGNVTHIEDGAQQAVYFKNRLVSPTNDYTYDAIYRLIQASGRERVGLNGGGPLAPTATSYNDVPRIGLAHPGDGNAMGTYSEQYQYDAAGNFLLFTHRGSDPANPGWTRSFNYNEVSQLELGKISNRLSQTTVGGSQTLAEPYSYDLHGNIVSMPQLQAMQWNYRDQLIMTRRQAVNAGDADGVLHAGERTYYAYNSAGDRARKVTESAAGSKVKERLYLGALEIYREYNAAGAVTLERQTLHVMDDRKRFALVETRTVDASLPPGTPPLVAKRYQFDNQLGSACLELDDAGAVITYEEYYPHGCTAYQAGRSAAEVSLKRYRHTGKERDEESGLYYHGTRYRAPWICRWTSCDPAGLGDNVNLYVFVRNNPLVFTDPTGQWSWGKVLGFAAGIVVGVAFTALTGGLGAGVILAGVAGGVAGGAANEIVEQWVDKGSFSKINWKQVGISAAIGGAFGGLFAGAGSFIANTQIGKRIAASLTGNFIGRWVGRAVYKVATSPSRAAGAARAVAGAARQVTEALEKLGEAAARRIGGPLAARAEANAARRTALEAAQADAASRVGGGGAQATLQGELNGEPHYATTHSGEDHSGLGKRAIETPQGRVQAPDPNDVHPELAPFEVGGYSRGHDAEFKLFGHTLLSTGRNSTGTLYLGVSAPKCPSCVNNLWNTRALIPGLQIISDMPSNAAGAAGGLPAFVPEQHEPQPAPAPVLELQLHF